MRSLRDAHTAAVALFFVAVITGCDTPPASTPDLASADDPRSCGPGITAVPYEGATHVTAGTAVDYRSNPPASGSHWGFWEDWGVYFNRVVPRETWVHNLEHGGIVLLFNCPTDAGTQSDPVDLAGADASSSDPADASTPLDASFGDNGSGDGGSIDGGAAPPIVTACPDITDALRALRAERKPDRYNAVRVLVTADPKIKTRAAAAAWNWTWQGDTVDVATLRCFIDRRYDRAPESVP